MSHAGRVRVLAVIAVATVIGVTIVFGGWPGGPPDGTTTFEAVADELPPGVVVEGATEVESTVARQGDAVSAAVTYLVDAPVTDVREQIEAGLMPNWQPRSSSSDGQTDQVLYDGPDGATLTVSVQPSVDGSAVAAVLARG